MQFLLIAKDGRDEHAFERRQSVRPDHLKLADKMKSEGKVLYGAALLDEKENMIGSIMVCEFPSRQDLDDWLKVEPYVVGNVWQDIDIQPCKVAPMFCAVKS